MVNSSKKRLLTRKELISNYLRSDKILRRAIHHKWISPHVGGGKGRRALWDPRDVSVLLKRLKQGEPPLLPCEVRKKAVEGGVTK